MSQNKARNMYNCVTQLIVNKAYICRTIKIYEFLIVKVFVLLVSTVILTKNKSPLGQRKRVSSS
jgi:hypothetical protein